MKALTLFEPWATLIALGHKTIETRSWATKHRGLIAIHAGKSDRFVGEWDGLWYDAVGGISGCAPKPPSRWPFGQIVAVANLVACERTEILHPSEKDRAFGDFSAGRFGWVLADISRVDPGIPARGLQMLWDVPTEILAQLNQPTGGRS